MMQRLIGNKWVEYGELLRVLKHVKSGSLPLDDDDIGFFFRTQLPLLTRVRALKLLGFTDQEVRDFEAEVAGGIEIRKDERRDLPRTNLLC